MIATLTRRPLSQQQMSIPPNCGASVVALSVAPESDS